MMDRHTAFDGTESESLLVGEARQASALVSQRRLNSLRERPMAHNEHRLHSSRYQRSSSRVRLQVYLVLHFGVGEVVDTQVTLGGGDDGERVGHVHAVGSLGKGDHSHGRGLPSVPVPQGLVPTAGAEHVQLVYVVCRFYRGIVLGLKGHEKKR
jgi:hypothetical protein